MKTESPDQSRIRPASVDDAEALARIYSYYVLGSIITFEEEAPSPAEMASRLLDVQAAALPWLIAEHSGRVLGYAYATRWKGRCAYRFSTEVTVYVDHAETGRGIGAKLYNHLLPVLKSGGSHVAIGWIALPNQASVRLHEKLGFEKVTHFKQVGFKFGHWIDVGYWQRIL